MFISFSICCNHFTSLAYEIFYAIKVELDLFDKIKEVVFSQLFPCVKVMICQTDFHPSKSHHLCKPSDPSFIKLQYQIHCLIDSSYICLAYHDLIAQWLEHLPGREKTMASIPVAGCKFYNRNDYLSSVQHRVQSS
jgi:hypothetical protein